MKRVLIVSHSTMAQGTKEAIELLLGKQEHLYAISAYTDNSNIEDTLAAFMEMDGYDQTVVFTDLFGGSVNSFMAKYVNDNVFVIAGFNLALVLDILIKDQTIDSTIIKTSIQEAQHAMILMNEEINKETNDEAFF